MRENMEYREKLLLPLRLKTFFLEGNLYRLDDRSQQSDYKTIQKYCFFFSKLSLFSIKIRLVTPLK